MEAITIGTQQYTDVRAALVEAGRLYSVVCLSRANYQAACAELGRALLVIKKQIKPGEWLRALAIAGIHAKTAQRAMRLAEAKAAGLDVGLHAAPAIQPDKANTCDQWSHGRANGSLKPSDRSVASGGADDLEPIVDPDMIATDEEMEAMVEDDDEDLGNEGLDDDLEDEELEDLPDDDDDVEDRVAGRAGSSRVDQTLEAAGASHARQAAEERGTSGEQLSLTAVWDEIDRARERARDVARESGKAERVAQAVRKFEAELEEIRGG